MALDGEPGGFPLLLDASGLVDDGAFALGLGGGPAPGGGPPGGGGFLAAASLLAWLLLRSGILINVVLSDGLWHFTPVLWAPGSC